MIHFSSKYGPYNEKETIIYLVLTYIGSYNYF